MAKKIHKKKQETRATARRWLVVPTTGLAAAVYINRLNRNRRPPILSDEISSVTWESPRYSRSNLPTRDTIRKEARDLLERIELSQKQNVRSYGPPLYGSIDSLLSSNSSTSSALSSLSSALSSALSSPSVYSGPRSWY